MSNSNVLPEDIEEKANSVPRYLELPLMSVGYMGQLIIDVINVKAKEVKKSRTLTTRSNTIKT
jgi:hypothetical protein